MCSDASQIYGGWRNIYNNHNLGVVFLYSADVAKRGFSDGQLYLLRVMCFFTFPFGLFDWMLL
jgi:hypothetical protein